MINKSKVAYLPNLDSLRGFAAFLVMILHFSSYLTPAVGEVFLQFTPFVVKSYLWVDLFFILSGVVLTHSYRESFTSGFAKNIYLNFIKKRFVRIYPLHLLTLVILVLLHWGLVSLINVGDDPMNILRNKTTLVTNVFLLHSTGLGDFGCYNCTSWNYPSWSISVEWVCYLFLPILFYLCLKLKKIMVLFIPVFYYLLFYFVEKDIGHLDVASSFGLMRGFIGFTWGDIDLSYCL
jgi:peptidoglycan/LPS O-acetylase OafA/YrhL